MRLRITLVCCLMAVLSVAAFAQRNADPVTGTWSGDWGPSASDRNPVTVELKFDGKSAVTGTVNPGPNAITLQKGTFDPASGLLKLEADAKDRRGNAIHYVIEGKVAAGSAAGSWNHDNRKGDFKITKK